MSIPALTAVLIATLTLGLIYFQRTPFAANPEVFLDGALVTLQILGVSAVLTLVIAFAAGLGRLSPWWPIRWLCTAYVEVFRGTSALVQLFWLFYVLPLFGPTIAPFTAGVLGVSLNVGAYAAVVVQASVRAVPRDQREAAIALNLSPFNRMRRIILPQAVRMMIPPFGNLAIQLFKLTALVSFIGISDLTYTAYQLNQTTYRTVEVFTIILFMYFAIGLSITIGMKLLERRFARGVAGVSAR
ncbi:MAG: ectoine/hydroxyectoine ABC transporter permease subunit EhuC [Marivita sp.]|uniref:ectoine/hydroxyectoine ABC transporter permease subunit EhuC n=1 Tax=Marivita sp. TaxID=2003365 RepID=UPI001B295ED1|nr:ectoine/hydroxyectoine ABC transporter permease subunit EhuC [Marivita sp.]MBO6884875.1 ectoine/hydroxyectoine ABC transporter permease subunit EhuC [Marivita sp.]